jgi:hypothetical protein
MSPGGVVMRRHVAIAPAVERLRAHSHRWHTCSDGVVRQHFEYLPLDRCLHASVVMMDAPIWGEVDDDGSRIPAGCCYTSWRRNMDGGPSVTLPRRRASHVNDRT